MHLLPVLLAAALAPAAAAPGVPDTLAQRMLACTACHGQEGRASSEGYFPRIAGKPAAYLFNQLVNFREGRRRGARMGALVEHLGDAYLQEMAAYFASLDLPYPPPATRGAPAALLARGAQLAREGDAARHLPACSACHGPQLMGMLPATPGLLALPRDYLIAQIGRWKVGVRRTLAPDCMAQIAQRLGPEDLSAVATWLSAQPVPAQAQPAAAPTAPLPMRCAGAPEAAR
ncbi:MAG: cytochrome c4 [Burkholderiales bacterium]|nr:cytochrome c4 [Burkholderiales bacterium]